MDESFGACSASATAALEKFAKRGARRQRAGFKFDGGGQKFVEGGAGKGCRDGFRCRRFGEDQGARAASPHAYEHLRWRVSAAFQPERLCEQSASPIVGERVVEYRKRWIELFRTESSSGRLKRKRYGVQGKRRGICSPLTGVFEL